MLAAYVLPAVLAWSVLGLAIGALLRVLPASWPTAAIALLLMAAYGTVYGLVELSGAARPAAPGRRWQVPQDLMIGAGSGRRVLVWGTILGPGFLTRNPFAGFAVLPVLVAACAGRTGGGLLAAVAVAAAAGAAHAAGRAIALLRATARPPDEPFALLLRSLHWRTADGLALLALAAAALVSAGFRLG